MANAPQSRKEAYLAAIAGVPGIDKPMTPQSREEEYLGLIADHVINNDVIANPSLVGTEANLTSVQIDGTKYAVPQGGSTHLYQHNVRFKYAKSSGIKASMTINFINNSSVEITTLADLASSMISLGFVSEDLIWKHSEESSCPVCGSFKGYATDDQEEPLNSWAPVDWVSVYINGSSTYFTFGGNAYPDEDPQIWFDITGDDAAYASITDDKVIQLL